jgi:S-(hydroxymethyl)glutathione dehydrogenase/alcohol dehydrogenase
MKTEGLEGPSPKYKWGERIVNAGKVTTFSNYSIISENRLVLKPVTLNFKQAVLFGCAIPTGAGLVLNDIIPSVNANICLIGLGGIGIAALMTLLSVGARNIIAIDTAVNKLEFAKSLGVPNILNPNIDDIMAGVKNLFPNGADICIECAGLSTTIELGFDLVRPRGGELIFASHPPDNEKISIKPHDLISGKKIRGSWGGGAEPCRDVPKFSKILVDAGMPLSDLVTDVYPLSSINDAIHDLERGRAMRPIIDLWNG